MRPVRAVAAAASVSVACVAYGALVERRWYRLRREALPGALRSPGSGPLRVLHVSDLHLASSDESLAGFIRSLAGESFDLVVATGDLVGAVGFEDATVELLATLTVEGT
ncbi:MAG: metallophosphoesterase, partial [Actinomycetota bacterium]|nr:metallophosphoesterase [Actinomycetota bacterium]